MQHPPSKQQQLQQVQHPPIQHPSSQQQQHPCSVQHPPKQQPPFGQQPPQNNIGPENTKRHRPNFSVEPKFVQLAVGRGIDGAEYDTIIGAAKTAYEQSRNDNKEISFRTGTGIRNILKGEWFVFVSDKNKKFDFSLSTVASDDYMTFTLGNTLFQIVRLKQ